MKKIITVMIIMLFVFTGCGKKTQTYVYHGENDIYEATYEIECAEQKEVSTEYVKVTPYLVKNRDYIIKKKDNSKLGEKDEQILVSVKENNSEKSEYKKIHNVSVNDYFIEDSRKDNENNPEIVDNINKEKIIINIYSGEATSEIELIRIEK